MEQTTTSTPSPDTSPLRQLSNQMADAVERISASLVLVYGRERQPASGVVFAENLVLTANHVLEREDNLTVQTHDKRTLPAQLVGRDPATDLAVLRIANLGLAAATASTEKVRVGQLTIAVGRSANDGPMASSGVVSITGGRPLIDTQGDVLGILTTGLLNGIPLAIPMEAAKSIAETLVKQGHIKRGYLGISSHLVELPANQRAGRTQEHGLLLVKVDENSPAQKGGLLVGDILVALDGHAISDAEDLQVLLVGERVGKSVSVEVIRGNTLQTLPVTIGQRK